VSRELELNFSREQVSLNDLTSKLAHNKITNTRLTRNRNKILNAIETVKQLISSGKLVAEGDYKIVMKEDILFLQNYIHKAILNGEYVYDVETTGKDVFNDIIVGICLYTPGEIPLYIPVNHTDIDNVRVDGQLDEEDVKRILRPLLENKDCRYINHNQKFDGEFTQVYWGIRIANFYFDTQLAGKLLNENEENHKLKYLYAKYIKKDPSKWSAFGDLFEDIPFNYVPINIAGVYGGNDGIIPYKLYQFQSSYLRYNHPKDEFRKLAKIMFEIEMPLIPILIDMELRGVEIDEQRAAELNEKYSAELKELELELDRFVKRYEHDILIDETLNRLTHGEGKINYNSPPQLSRLLYKIMKLPVVSRKEPTGTGKKIIEKWLEHSRVDKDTKNFIKMFKQFKTIRKLLNDYINKLPKAVEPKTGAVHTQFNQYGAVTGRFSSSHPIHKINLQNIPSRNKEIRTIFKARDNYVLIGSDFSQIEPRTLASLSGDEEMINAYREGKDLYATMGARVYQMDYWDCMEKHEDGTDNPEGKVRRDTMKSVLLGIMYERSAKAIAEQFNKPLKWAEDLIEDFRRAYPKIELHRMTVINKAETFGYVTTLLGRKRRLPDMKRSDKEDWRYLDAHRQCLNAEIQGTAADIMKLAMIEVGNNEEFKALGAHMLLTVHDELICEAPEEHAKRVGEILTDCMKKVGEELLKLPMKCDVEITKVWYGAEYEFETEDFDDVA